MELYTEMLINLLQREAVHVTFPQLKFDTENIVELECYRALSKIKDILADSSLEDEACFHKIEEIVRVLEGVGSGGGSRHDFG